MNFNCKYVTTFHPKNCIIFQTMKLYNWKVGTYLQLQRWVSLRFQKWWSALITSKYVYWIAFDGGIHATLVTRFDNIIKRFLWLLFKKVLLDRFMSSRCFLYLVLPPITQCSNANKLYSNVFFSILSGYIKRAGWIIFEK